MTRRYISGLWIVLLPLMWTGCNVPSAEQRDMVFTQEAELLRIAASMTETALIPTETPVPTEMPLEEVSLPTEVPALSAESYFMDYTSQERYASWIRMLSGADPVTVGGESATIETRYSFAMFQGNANAKAYDWFLETVRQWVPEEAITLEPYSYEASPQPWYNIVITFPGTLYPDEQILYTAHLDSCVSTGGEDPMMVAPGADDNGTGLAAMLEALPVFAKTSFERTLKVVIFTGEENFQSGSKAYAAAHQSENIVGMLNMDMFGNDSDNDRCFEIHVGTLEGSEKIGSAFKQTLAEHDFGLTYDYFPYEIHEDKIQGDHNPFWNLNIPAVTVMENFSVASSEGGCGQGVRDDVSLTWHVVTDRIENVSIPYAFDIARAGTLTALRLAGAGTVDYSE